MTILDCARDLLPTDSKTNIEFPFEVPKGFDALRILFSYEPKALDDEAKSQRLIEEGFEHCAPDEYRSGYGDWREYLPVNNLVTLSIDAPDGYRGCAHRHAHEQEHILSRGFTSPGLVPLPIVAGKWRSVVNCHAVVTDVCHMRLIIEAMEGVDAQ